MVPRRQEVHYKPTAQYICSADADLDTDQEYVNVSNSDHNPSHYESIQFKVGEPMAVSHKVTDTVDDYNLVENDAYSIAKDKSDEYVIENTISGQ